MANTVGTFKADHHVIFGVSLAVIGIFGVAGSITGRLAVMLAALFDPGALVDGASSGSGGIGLVAVPLIGTAPEGPTAEEPSEGGSGPATEVTGTGSGGATSSSNSGGGNIDITSGEPAWLEELATELAGSAAP